VLFLQLPHRTVLTVINIYHVYLEIRAEYVSVLKSSFMKLEQIGTIKFL